MPDYSKRPFDPLVRGHLTFERVTDHHPKKVTSRIAIVLSTIGDEKVTAWITWWAQITWFVVNLISNSCWYLFCGYFVSKTSTLNKKKPATSKVFLVGTPKNQMLNPPPKKKPLFWQPAKLTGNPYAPCNMEILWDSISWGPVVWPWEPQAPASWNTRPCTPQN